MDEKELLRRYVDSADDDAFGQLVTRHGTWMFSTARRQLGDEHQAEDVTQAVFLLLARRARKLAGYAYLGGWLFGTLQYCVKEAKRQRSRQQAREREAARMRSEHSQEDASWTEISPMLEDALAGLAKADRDAVLLRFYERRPLAEIGIALGVSEEAARKRVDRAVQKLRGKLEAAGVNVSTAALSGFAETQIVGQLPAHAREALSRIVPDRITGLPAGIAKGANAMMTVRKVKLFAATTALLLATVSISGLVARAASSEHVPAPATQTALPIATGSFEIAGAVPRAGTYPFSGGACTLLQALAGTGVDLTRAGDQMVEVTRPAANGSAEAHYYWRVRDVTDASVDFFVRPGDRVELHEASRFSDKPVYQLSWYGFYISGRVERAGAYSSGVDVAPILFKQALIAAGYKPNDNETLTVCRRLPDGGVDRYVWSIAEVMTQHKPEFIVHPGDVLMVGAAVSSSTTRPASYRVLE